MLPLLTSQPSILSEPKPPPKVRTEEELLEMKMKRREGLQRYRSKSRSDEEMALLRMRRKECNRKYRDKISAILTEEQREEIRKKDRERKARKRTQYTAEEWAIMRQKKLERLAASKNNENNNNNNNNEADINNMNINNSSGATLGR
jgi:hypothetical protein